MSSVNLSRFQFNGGENAAPIENLASLPREDQERLVLATGKNFSHRIYLGQGIWADLTLMFHKGDWFDLPWTFPDYATPEIKAHLTRIRDMYKDQLKKDASCPKV